MQRVARVGRKDAPTDEIPSGARTSVDPASSGASAPSVGPFFVPPRAEQAPGDGGR